VIRTAKTSDAGLITEIYNHFVENSIFTFDESPTSTKEMSTKILELTSNSYPFIVYEASDSILGFAYACPWKLRSAYKHTAESTIYITPNSLQKGIGSQLYKELIHQLQKINTHSILAGISLPNDISVAFHEKFGFEKVAQLKEVGFKFNRWIDVGYWELILNED
tara:strand:- start:198 stop:692 length:495 start_codon:yes stop_codon:yes gene_type:complete